MAGLSAATRLQHYGFTVTVLEAQSTPGGRIRTQRSAGLPFDEGASWIHGPRGNPIKDLADKAGASTYRTDDDSVTVYDTNGTAYTDAALTDAEKQFNKALEAVQQAGTDAQSFATVFHQLYPAEADNRLWKYMLSAYLEFSTGGDITQLSSRYFYDDEAFRGQDVIITNGYDTLTNYLAKDLNVRLNSPVTSIQYGGSQVEVGLAQETLTADFVVVTGPLGVLQRKDIVFTPGLPAQKEAAINSLQMGVVNKFLLVWDTPFWDTSLQYIGYTPEVKGQFNYFLNLRTFSQTNALMTFAYGDYATLTEGMTDAAITDIIVQQLQTIHGTSVPQPNQLLRTRWGSDPFAYGAYSFVPAGATSAAYDVVADAVDNKLFFAGEHTSKDYRGTVHGAYLSGIREADKLLALV